MDSPIHDEGGCGSGAKESIELLLEHGLALFVIAKDAKSDEDDLREILSGSREAGESLTERLKRLCEHRGTVYGSHLQDNAEAIAAIVALRDRGVTSARIAKTLERSDSHICKVIRGQHKVGGKLTDRLKRFEEECMSRTIQSIVSGTEAGLTVLATKKSPSAPLDSKRCSKMADSVRRSAIERLVGGHHERIVLEEGIPGLVVQVDGDMLIVAVDRAQCRDAVGDPIPHEFEAIGRWFLAQARECDKELRRHKPSEPHPKKWG